MPSRTRSRSVTLWVAVLAGTASGQSDPVLFGTVYNIGDVPAGSIFDIPTAVTGTRVGDVVGIFSGDGFITPTFLDGDVLNSNSQLNIFEGGSIFSGFFTGVFFAGPSDGTGSNIEVNISGGSVGTDFNAFSGSTVNISSGNVDDDFRAPLRQHGEHFWRQCRQWIRRPRWQ